MKMKSVPLTIKNRPQQTAFKQAIDMEQRRAVAFSPTYMKSGKIFKRLVKSNGWRLYIGLHVLTVNLFVKGKKGVVGKRNPGVDKLSNDPEILLPPFLSCSSSAMHAKHAEQFLAHSKHLIDICYTAVVATAATSISTTIAISTASS